jgi:hypothetical protein
VPVKKNSGKMEPLITMIHVHTLPKVYLKIQSLSAGHTSYAKAVPDQVQKYMAQLPVLMYSATFVLHE